MLQCTNCGLHLTSQQVDEGACPNCQTPVAEIRAAVGAHANSPIQTLDPSQHAANLPPVEPPAPATMKTSAVNVQPYQGAGSTVSGGDTNQDNVQTVDGEQGPGHTMVAHGSQAARGTDAAKEMWNALADSATSPMMTVKTEEMTRGREQQLVIHRRTLAPEDEPDSDDADYRLTRFLGEGGMGSVYVAEQGSVQRDVAVKMLKPGLAKNVADRRKFLYEAQITGDLDHPNIVPIHDLGISDDGTLFYSMKLVDGTPWLETLDQKSKTENIAIFMKVCDAVAFAHSRHVIHRDLKPENVMLGKFGEVVVMDWGLAVDLKEGKQFVLGGTPAYMAPEMARHDIELIDKTSDVYLLGAMLFHVVTGYPPHPGQSVVECVEAAARNEILPADGSDELIAIALKAMADTPEQRQQSVEQLQADIRQYQSHAESVVLTTRALEDLDNVASTKGYDEIQRCVFAFEEAIELWPQNQKAIRGLEESRIVYAQRALENEDFDLGLSQVDASNPNHRELYHRLVKGNEDRIHRQKRLRAARKSAMMFLMLAVGVTAVGLVYFMFSSQQLSLRAKELSEARDELQIEVDAKEKARSALDTANQNLQNEVVAKEQARLALDQANQNLQKEVAAKEQARAQLADEVQQKEQARSALATANESLKSEIKAKEDARAAEARMTQAALASERQGQLNVYQSQVLLAESLIAQSKVGAAFDLMEPLKNGDPLDPDGNPTISRYVGWELFRLYELANYKKTEQVFTIEESSRYAANDRGTIIAVSVGDRLFVKRAQSESIAEYEIPWQPDFIEVLGDTGHIAVGQLRGRIQLLNTANGALNDVATEYDDGLYCMKFLRDGTLLTVGSEARNIFARYWTLSAGQLSMQPRPQGQDIRLALKPQPGEIPTGLFGVSSDGAMIVMEKQNRQLHFFDMVNDVKSYEVRSGERYYIEGYYLNDVEPATTIVCDPIAPKRRIYLAMQDGRIQIIQYDEQNQFSLDMIQAHDSKINFLTADDLMTETGERPVLVSCGRDATIHVIDRETHEFLATLVGHRSPIYRCVVEENRDIVSIDDRGVVRQWNLLDDRPVHEVRLRHPDRRGVADFTALAVNKDLGLVAGGDTLGGISSWVLDNDSVIRQQSFTGPGHPRNQSISVERRGTTVFTRSNDGKTLIWDLPSGRIVGRLGDDRTDGKKTDLSVSLDGKWIAHYAPHYNPNEETDSDQPRYVHVWNADSPQQPALKAFIADSNNDQYDPNKDRDITAFALSDDGRLLMTGYERSGIAVWDTGSKNILWRQDMTAKKARVQTYGNAGARIRHLDWLKDRGWLIAGLEVDGKIIVDIWKGVLEQAPPTEPETRIFEDEPMQGELVAIRSGADLISVLTESANQLHAYVYNIQQEQTAYLEIPFDRSLNRAWLDESGTYVSIIENQQIMHWDLLSGQVGAPGQLAQTSPPIGIDPGEMNLVRADRDGFVYRTGPGSVWISRLNGSESFHTVPQPEVRVLEFSKDGQQALSCYADGRVWIWTLPQLAGQPEARQSVGQLSGSYRHAAMAPNGQQLALITENWEVRLLDLDEFAMGDALPAADSSPMFNTLCWSDDSARLLAGTTDGKVFIWNAQSGDLYRQPIAAHTSEIKKIVCQNGSNMFATLDVEGRISLWTPDENGEFSSVTFTDQATDMSFDPQSDRILVGNQDGSAAIWLMAFDGNPIPTNHDAAVKRVQTVFRVDTTKSEGDILASIFSDTGREIATSTESEQQVVIWKTRAWDQ